MDPSWLGEMRRMIGMSRNHLSWIVGVSPQLVARWETGDTGGLTEDAIDTIENLRLDFDAATSWLDEQDLTWDNVVTFRTAAMKFGVSTPTLQSLLRRADIEPIDFGLLGRWVTHEDLVACRK